MGGSGCDPSWAHEAGADRLDMHRSRTPSLPALVDDDAAGERCPERSFGTFVDSDHKYGTSYDHVLWDDFEGAHDNSVG